MENEAELQSCLKKSIAKKTLPISDERVFHEKNKELDEANSKNLLEKKLMSLMPWTQDFKKIKKLIKT